MANILEFKRPEKNTNVRAEQISLINERYNRLSDAMDETKPYGVLLENSWFSVWLTAAMDKLPEEEQAAIMEEEFVVMAMFTDNGLLTHWLNTARWQYQQFRNNVIFADCEAEEGKITYPSPMCIYKLGAGVSLLSRNYVFDGEFDPVAIETQRYANSKCRRNVKIEELPDEGTPELRSIMAGCLLEELLKEFFLDSVVFQDGWKATLNGELIQDVNEDVEHYVKKGLIRFSFIHPISNWHAIEWSLVIDTNYYGVLI